MSSLTHTKTPSKPKPPKASDKTLLEHYNSRVADYNAKVNELPDKKKPATGLQFEFKTMKHVQDNVLDKDNEPVKASPEQARKFIIKLIRRQNFRLGRHIKARAIELLLQHRVDKDGNQIKYNDKYSSGQAYQEVLEILWKEFPEASTSAACLRWYVVHMREEANDEGAAWPDLPAHRPRSISKKKSND